MSEFEYPVRCVCPGCGQRKLVVLQGNVRHVLEQHTIVASQISDDLKDSCLIEYPCPASGAKVSPFKKPRTS
jgi:hypothetical protein